MTTFIAVLHTALLPVYASPAGASKLLNIFKYANRAAGPAKQDLKQQITNYFLAPSPGVRGQSPFVRKIDNYKHLMYFQ